MIKSKLAQYFHCVICIIKFPDHVEVELWSSDRGPQLSARDPQTTKLQNPISEHHVSRLNKENRVPVNFFEFEKLGKGATWEVWKSPWDNRQAWNDTWQKHFIASSLKDILKVSTTKTSLVLSKMLVLP